MPEEFLTIKQVAALLGLHEITVRRHVQAGKIPAAKIGNRWRVRREDLYRLFPQPTTKPARPQ